MKRRLELARALLHEPSLLVMDEPTTGLDERFFREAWERIEQLRAQRGLTVLLTTHRAEEAERCDRVAVVDGGRVIARGHAGSAARARRGRRAHARGRASRTRCAPSSRRASSSRRAWSTAAS